MESETSRDVDSDKENVSPILKSGIKRKRHLEVQKIEKIQNSTSDEKINTIENETMNKIVDEKMKKIENEKMNKMEDERMNKIENEKMNKIKDEEINKIKDDKINKIKDEEMNKIKDDKINKIENEKMNKIKDEEMNRIKDEEMNKITDEKMNKIKDAKMNKFENTRMNKIEEKKMNKIVDTKMNKKDETKMNKIDDKKIKKINEPKELNVPRKISNSPVTKNSPNFPSKIASTIKLPAKNIIKNRSVSDEATIKSPSTNSRVRDKNNLKISKNSNDKKIKENSETAAKLEKSENRNCHVDSLRRKISKDDKIAWIQNILTEPKVQSPRSPGMEKLHDICPQPGDEAEKRNKALPVGEKIYEKTREIAAMEISRKSIVENMKYNDVTGDGVSLRGKNIDKRGIGQKSKITEILNDREESNDEENNETEEEEDDDDDVVVKKKKFGKIKDLISEEQKIAVEKFYICDMSAVDEQTVGEKIIFLDRKKFGCRLCDANYTRQDKCQVHIWGHLDMKPYRCKACDFSTVTVSNIRCHVRKNHLKIKPYVCEYCDKCFVTGFLLEEHINTHTGARPHRCEDCNFTSTSRQGLSYHRETHKLVKDIICHVCGKNFYSKGRLRAHLIVHDKDKAANMCKLCSIYLCNSEALQRHHANVHNRDYVCKDCGKRCKSKKALNNHSNVHSAAKYKCNLCSNVYKSSHILKEHLLKHKGIRKYKCNICQKDFGQQSHLAAHKAVHSDKRFFCPGCNRAFNRHDNMKMHTKRCEPFLANPELSTLLTIRRRRSKSPKNNDEKSIITEDNVSSMNELIETDYKKTDLFTNENNTIEISNMPSSMDEQECNENFTTIIVENTIPCT